MFGSDLQFLQTLWQVLQDTYISFNHQKQYWDQNGTTIIVQSLEEFSQNILKKYFHSMSLLSFQRRLKHLGFTFNKHQNKKISFSHHLFLKNSKESLGQIRMVKKTHLSFLPFAPIKQERAQILESIQVAKRNIEKEKKDLKLLQTKISKFINSMSSIIVRKELQDFNQRVQIRKIQELIANISHQSLPMNSLLYNKIIKTFYNVINNQTSPSSMFSSQQSGQIDQISLGQ